MAFVSSRQPHRPLVIALLLFRIAMIISVYLNHEPKGWNVQVREDGAAAVHPDLFPLMLEPKPGQNF